MIDMDHFKRFNDERGHQAGDWLLAETARAWTRELRPTDTLARYGGEEFVVVLPNCTEPAALQAIERLRAAVPAGQTCSAGVATQMRDEPADLLLERADAAMYLAKRSGRNRTIAAPSKATKGRRSMAVTMPRGARPSSSRRRRSAAGAAAI